MNTKLLKGNDLAHKILVVSPTEAAAELSI